MASLKTYTPKLAQLLKTTPATLYERQRALVRAGLLDQGRGRGPGSGVKATASSVALLLIASMATENLSETEVRTREILSTKRNNLSFYDAIVQIIRSKKLADRVNQITISRSSPRADIMLKVSKGLSTRQQFVQSGVPEPAVRVLSEIDGKIVQEITKDLAEMSDGSTGSDQ